MKDGVRVGIDGGGTRARAVVLDATGAELARAEGPAGIVRAEDPVSAAEVVAELTRRVLAAAGASPAQAVLCCALAGAGRAPEREAVRVALALSGVAADVVVVGDAEALLADAFDGGAGVLLIAGTGSIAWARGVDGRQHRVGGWGHIMGDEGSGYDIGREALSAIARTSDEREAASTLFDACRPATGVERPEDLIAWASHAAKADIAALAPVVLECADAGDDAALRIRERAVRELVLLTTTVVRRAALTQPLIAPAGGLIGPAGPLRPHLVERLRAVISDCRILDHLVDGARGAARIAAARS